MITRSTKFWYFYYLQDPLEFNIELVTFSLVQGRKAK